MPSKLLKNANSINAGMNCAAKRSANIARKPSTIPATSVALGRKVWWPGRLSRTPDPVRPERQPEPA